MIALLLLLLSFSAQATWQEGTHIGVPVENARCDWAIIQFGTTFNNIYQMDTWYTFDVTVAPWNVPPDALAVFIKAIQIITHGKTVEGCDMESWFRANGDTQDGPGYYSEQVVTAIVGEGVRNNSFGVVPLKDGKFQWKFHRHGGLGFWPDYCAVGGSWFIQGYVRP